METACPYEESLIRELLSGKLSGPLSEHIQTCTICRSSVTIFERMQQLRAESSVAANLPAYPWIVWQAELELQKKQQKKFHRIYGWGNAVAVCVFVMLCAAALSGQGYDLKNLAATGLSVILPAIAFLVVSEFFVSIFFKKALRNL